MSEDFDGLVIGFCSRCGDQLDGASPAADLWCWRCSVEVEEA